MQMFRFRGWYSLIITGLLLFSVSGAIGHPVPDVPVRAFFDSDGSVRFEVEVDLRCFAVDPESELYYINKVLRSVTDERKAELQQPLAEFLENTLKIYFPPAQAAVERKFEVSFGKVGGGELKEDDDPVALIATWKTQLPAEATGYQLEAVDRGILSVLFINHLDGIEQKRMQVLFPGEISKILDLTNIAEDAVKGAAPPEAASAVELEDDPSAAGADEAAVDGPGPEDVSNEKSVEGGGQTASDNRNTLILVSVVGLGLGLAVVYLLRKQA
jgi:hypothetical protein